VCDGFGAREDYPEASDTGDHDEQDRADRADPPAHPDVTGAPMDQG
jgi:hypothetical protein